MVAIAIGNRQGMDDHADDKKFRKHKCLAKMHGCDDKILVNIILCHFGLFCKAKSFLTKRLLKGSTTPKIQSQVSAGSMHESWRTSGWIQKCCPLSKTVGKVLLYVTSCVPTRGTLLPLELLYWSFFSEERLRQPSNKQTQIVTAAPRATIKPIKKREKKWNGPPRHGSMNSTHKKLTR